MYVPRIRAILDGFLSILPPSISIFKMINIALCHKGEARLSWLLLFFLLLLIPEIIVHITIKTEILKRNKNNRKETLI